MQEWYRTDRSQSPYRNACSASRRTASSRGRGTARGYHSKRRRIELGGIATENPKSYLLQEPRLAFIKHEHWTSQLQGRLADIEIDIHNKMDPTEVLQEARSRMLRGIAESKESCNLSSVWTSGKINCSLLVKDVLFTGGLLSYAKPYSFPSLESRTSLFHPLRYSYAESENTLPLFVVADRETWSAAEYFAAILQDNHAAVIVGEVTGGAGCGYTNGGIATTLKYSHAQVKMPDCARLRRDGSNEVNGVFPDVLLPWTDHDTPYSKVAKLLDRLKPSIRSTRAKTN